jgi:lysophospholipase L1-like esterase
MVAVVLSGLAVQQPSLSVAEEPPALIVLGDSISAGCCAPEEEHWPNVLAGRLGADLSNLARGGATSESLIGQARAWPSGRIESQLSEAVSLIVEAEDVAAVTLGIGLNDFLLLREPATGESCLVAGTLDCQMLLENASQSLSENLDIIMAELKSAMSPETPLLVMSYYLGDCEDGLNGIIRAAVNDHGADLANVCEHFVGEMSGLLHTDGIHEAAAGHAVIADVFTNTLPTDGDSDGLSDLMEGVLGTDPVAPDSDADGCLDGAEFGPEEGEGGRRDPGSFWDFFDTPNASNVRDQVIDVGDIFRVVDRFGAFGDPSIDPLSAPPASGYHTAFDRSPPGPGGDSWDLSPPYGTVDIGDIFASVAQFGHSCA